MKILFAGPSLTKQDIDQIQASSAELTVRGPAVWGDVTKAVLDGATVVGIIDGCFEQTRSVWHKEILYALSKGVSVAGAASMGALRAAECDAYGMLGFGRVYKGYVNGDLVDDSDVALVHAPGELGYEHLSEPRVNLLETLDAMRDSKLLNFIEWRSAVTAARRQHYTELSSRSVLNMIPISDETRRERLIRWADDNWIDVKRADALELVDWIQQQQDEYGSSTDWEFKETAQWLSLFEKVAGEHQRGAGAHLH